MKGVTPRSSSAPLKLATSGICALSISGSMALTTGPPSQPKKATVLSLAKLWPVSSSANLGLPPVSRTISSIGRPLIPPLRLARSNTACAPAIHGLS